MLHKRWKRKAAMQRHTQQSFGYVRLPKPNEIGDGQLVMWRKELLQNSNKLNNKTKVICANSKFELRNVHCGRGCVSELRVWRKRNVTLEHTHTYRQTCEYRARILWNVDRIRNKHVRTNRSCPFWFVGTTGQCSWTVSHFAFEIMVHQTRWLCENHRLQILHQFCGEASIFSCFALCYNKQLLLQHSRV